LEKRRKTEILYKIKIKQGKEEKQNYIGMKGGRKERKIEKESKNRENIKRKIEIQKEGKIKRKMKERL
jgi:hypothetical protein